MSEEISVEGGVGHSTVSRRTVLKGAAVVGGTVWVAPVIESFASKAAAASAGTPNFCLNGIVSISWLALIVEDTANSTAYVAMINYNSTDITWGTTQSFPCDKSSTWTPPSTVNGVTVASGSPPAGVTLITVTSASASAITVNVASDAVILQEEEHGGAGPHNGGSTCASTTVSFPGPGSVTFYANSSGTCP